MQDAMGPKVDPVPGQEDVSGSRFGVGQRGNGKNLVVDSHVQ